VKQSLIKVSIVTIVYNSAKTLEDTILSVLNQTYRNIEFIIVDGGSTDGSIDIIKRYQERITWISEPDKGISDAFNKGIALSTGELIGIINADDWYERDAVQVVVESFKSDYDVYCGNINLISETGNVSKTKKSRIAHLSLGMHIMHPSVFVTKKVYDNIGLFNTNFKIAMDYDMLLRIREQKYKFKYIDKTVANMRTEGASSDVKKMHREEWELMSKNLNGSSFILAFFSNFSNRFLYYFMHLIS
jgi:glycosyltransferase involved in cell wall biosynthesis